MTESFLHSNRLKNDSLGKFFSLALSAHVLLAAFAYLISFVFNFQLFESKNKNADVIQSSVRVDVVGMPKFTVQELKNLDPTATSVGQKVDSTPKKAEVESKSDVEFKTTEKKVKLSSLFSSLSKRPVKKAKKRKKKGSVLSAKELNSLALEGNKVSKGQSLVGDSLKGAQGAYIEYVSAMPSYVRPYWKLPSYLLDKGLKARIRVYVSQSGRIIKTEIYESSGVGEFDKRALEALKKTGSFPAPEKSIWTRLTSGDVILGFPL
tara:strand:+ start:12830 stop:13621 length:792 start_codon:yes stop_codon:yes gene_type:complete